MSVGRPFRHRLALSSAPVSLLSAHGLCLRRHSGFALAGVDLALRAGELLVMVGPNGSGKSTLIHCLSGLLSPTGGQVRLGEESLARMAPRERARRIGLLLQRSSSAWPVSVASLVSFGRIPHGDVPDIAVRGEDKAGEAIAAALRVMELEALADRPVDTLSGGEQARAHLARVLAGEPAVVLADEPVAELDPVHALRVMELLKGLARGGKAVLAVMHDLSMALRFADRIAVMAAGRLIAVGEPEAIARGDVLERAFGVRFARVRQDGVLGVLPTLPRSPKAAPAQQDQGQ
jgi:iron complex transport system ATP-binding protein